MLLFFFGLLELLHLRTNPRHLPPIISYEPQYFTHPHYYQNFLSPMSSKFSKLTTEQLNHYEGILDSFFVAAMP